MLGCQWLLSVVGLVLQFDASRHYSPFVFNRPIVTSSTSSSSERSSSFGSEVSTCGLIVLTDSGFPLAIGGKLLAEGSVTSRPFTARTLRGRCVEGTADEATHSKSASCDSKRGRRRGGGGRRGTFEAMLLSAGNKEGEDSEEEEETEGGGEENREVVRVAGGGGSGAAKSRGGLCSDGRPLW